jgi:hypothetical protein
LHSVRTGLQRMRSPGDYHSVPQSAPGGQLCKRGWDIGWLPTQRQRLVRCQRCRADLIELPHDCSDCMTYGHRLLRVCGVHGLSGPSSIAAGWCAQDTPFLALKVGDAATLPAVHVMVRRQYDDAVKSIFMVTGSPQNHAFSAVLGPMMARQFEDLASNSRTTVMEYTRSLMAAPGGQVHIPPQFGEPCGCAGPFVHGPCSNSMDGLACDQQMPLYGRSDNGKQAENGKIQVRENKL